MWNLTGVPLVQLQEWRTQALGGLAALASGQRTVSLSTSVNGSGRSATFQNMDAGLLKQWLAALDAAIYALGGGVLAPRRRAIGFRF